MSLVLDSSVALAWAYGEEDSDILRRVFEQISEKGASVPGLWRLEVGNVLEMAVRRGRITGESQAAILADLACLPISVDLETDRQAWGATGRLAARHRLTLYDAAYLELAERRQLPLATLDRDLYRAARAENVPTCGAELLS